MLRREGSEVTAAALPIDFERLFKLRLAAARHGEIDAAGGWNTRGILDRHGALALKSGFPSTYPCAQPWIAFAVAPSRCHALFDPPGCMTRSGTSPRRSRIDSRCIGRNGWTRGSGGAPFTRCWRPRVGKTCSRDCQWGLVDSSQVAAVNKLRRSAEGRSVPLSGTFLPNALLAAGFAKSERGSPAIPYARLED